MAIVSLEPCTVQQVVRNTCRSYDFTRLMCDTHSVYCKEQPVSHVVNTAYRTTVTDPAFKNMDLSIIEILCPHTVHDPVAASQHENVANKKIRLSWNLTFSIDH